jgi:uncharacterized protein YdhG (YjbR/CyaY superfamily)
VDAGLFEEHFQRATPDVRARLQDIAGEVERRVPDAVRCIGYQMPAFKRDRAFFYFAAFKKHIGIYPPLHAPDGLVAELEPYRGPKGNLLFSHVDPLPVELIGRAAEALARAYGQRL